MAGVGVFVCSVTQSCPTLCNPMDCSLPGSSVHTEQLCVLSQLGVHACTRLRQVGYVCGLLLSVSKLTGSPQSCCSNTEVLISARRTLT